jgi:hypothetical protein
MYKTQSDKNINQNMTNSATDFTEVLSVSQERRVRKTIQFSFSFDFYI